MTPRYWSNGQVDNRRQWPQYSFMAETTGWIAIVDDDPSVLKALRRSLRGRAIRTKTYGSAQEFLTALPDGLPECLILDLQMPGMTGLELLEHVKREGIQIPTIVVTAHGDTGVRKRCESAGAIAFLAKPFWKSSLHAAIDKAIRSERNGRHEPS